MPNKIKQKPELHIGDKLRAAIKAKGVKQVDVAREFGVKPPTVSVDWQKYGRIDKSHIPHLVEYFGLPYEYWLGDAKLIIQENNKTIKSKAVIAVDDEEENKNVVRVRKVKIKISAGITGFATEPDEEDSNPIYFQKSWMVARGYKQANLIAISVKGDSMEPGLYDGDIVVVNTADIIPKDGKVFAINYEGEPIVKRMVRDSGSWWLSSDNQDKSRHPLKLCAGESCIVIGRIVNKQSEQI